MKNRCAWVSEDSLYKTYHDTEWAVPVFDDKILFEFLVLESFQAGLSWITILKKRENFREAFYGFDYDKIAQFDDSKITELLHNTDIIRHRKKIEAAINNAQRFIEIKGRHGSFSNYIWQFVDNKPIINHWKSITEVPATTDLSDLIAKDLKQKRFKFLGSTTVYAYLQAVGIVNDHTLNCFCHPNNL
ncbi:MAG: DNA-3-methyladenine glycosylase I [Weeksellaceae bacterium]